MQTILEEDVRIIYGKQSAASSLMHSDRLSSKEIREVKRERERVAGNLPRYFLSLLERSLVSVDSRLNSARDGDRWCYAILG